MSVACGDDDRQRPRGRAREPHLAALIEALEVEALLCESLSDPPGVLDPCAGDDADTPSDALLGGVVILEL